MALMPFDFLVWQKPAALFAFTGKKEEEEEEKARNVAWQSKHHSWILCRERVKIQNDNTAVIFCKVYEHISALYTGM